ncbi:MAG TPA: SDR family oxidoreductase [Solirubrobacteraceae bacterium]|nr:SDR family oxidoreductase [Solirubrobacteraceae bacterium]
MSANLGLAGRFALLAGANDTGVRQRLRDDGMEVVELETDDRASWDQAVAEAMRSTPGKLDLLVISQDTSLEGSLGETPEPAFLELLEKNLTAAFRIGRACFAAMRERGGGSIVFVASEGAVRAVHESAAVSVAAAGLIAVAELFAAEGASHGIRANAVCPRRGTDVSAVVAWLASDESAHLSGATLRVDDAEGAAMVVDTRI